MDDAESEDDGAQAWQVIVDAWVRLEDQRTSLRGSVIGVYLAVILGSVLVRRFVFVTAPERWLLVLVPSAALAATGVLDHYVMGRRVRRLRDLARRTEAGSQALGDVQEHAVDEPRSGLALAVFYGLPAALGFALGLWGIV